MAATVAENVNSTSQYEIDRISSFSGNEHSLSVYLFFSINLFETYNTIFSLPVEWKTCIELENESRYSD